MSMVDRRMPNRLVAFRTRIVIRCIPGFERNDEALFVCPSTKSGVEDVLRDVHRQDLGQANVLRLAMTDNSGLAVRDQSDEFRQFDIGKVRRA